LPTFAAFGSSPKMIVTGRGQRFTISYGFLFFSGGAVAEGAGVASGVLAADVDAFLASALVAGSFPSPPQPATRRRVARITEGRMAATLLTSS
jgi:hypothetical protein